MPTMEECQRRPEVFGRYGWTWTLIAPAGGKRHLQGDYQETWCGKVYDTVDWKECGQYYSPGIDKMCRKGVESICKRCASVWRTT